MLTYLVSTKYMFFYLKTMYSNGCCEGDTNAGQSCHMKSRYEY